MCVFVFDLLHHDGETLLGLPLRERRARLAAALPRMRPGYVQLATSVEIGGLGAQEQEAAGAAPAAAAAGAGSSSSQQAPSAMREEPEEGEEHGAGAEQQQALQAPPDAEGGAPPPEAGDAAAAPEARLFELLVAAFDAGAEGLMLKRLDTAAGGRRRARARCPALRCLVAALPRCFSAGLCACLRHTGTC